MAKKKNKDKKGLFTKGNNVAEKWTAPIVIKLFSAMIKTLSEDEDNKQATNPVRANDIKLFKEVCLIHDITSDDFSYLYTKFNKNDSVLRLVKKIKDICECRLNYSASAMDIFILKNHYGYNDKTEQEITQRTIKVVRE